MTQTTSGNTGTQSQASQGTGNTGPGSAAPVAKLTDPLPGASAPVQPPSPETDVPEVLPTVDKFDLLEDDIGIQNLLARAWKAAGREHPDAEPQVSKEKVPADKLPPSFHGTEDDAARLYPQYLPNDTERRFPMDSVFAYRGVDRPSFKVGKFQCTGRHSATILFHDGPGGDITFGTTYPSKDTRPEERCLDVTIRPDTQMPSVFFDIKRADSSRVKMNLYANSIARNQRNIGFDTTFGNDEYVKHKMPKNARLLQLANEGKVVRVDIVRYLDNEPPTTGARGGPIWTCQQTDAKALIDQISHRAQLQATGALGDQAPLDYQDQLIACLNESRQISIWLFAADLEQSDTEMGVLRSFDKFMKSCLWAAATRGNFWWYTLHTDIPLTSDDYPFNNGSRFLQHPRWLNTFYEVTWVDGAPVDYIPLSSASFFTPDTGLYPDSHLSTFISRLSAVREVQQQHWELVSLMKPSGHNITCKLRHLDDEEQYLASLCFNDLQNPSQLKALRPEFKRRVRINLTLEGSKISLEGDIGEDVSEVKPHATAVCKQTMGSPLGLVDADYEHWVTVQFLTDYKSQILHSEAVLQQVQKRREDRHRSRGRGRDSSVFRPARDFNQGRAIRGRGTGYAGPYFGHRPAQESILAPLLLPGRGRGRGRGG